MTHKFKYFFHSIETNKNLQQELFLDFQFCVTFLFLACQGAINNKMEWKSDPDLCEVEMNSYSHSTSLSDLQCGRVTLFNSL